MAARAWFAAVALSFSIPALAQQPVYPNFPPPPPASGESAPHPASPDQADQADNPEEVAPVQQPPAQQQDPQQQTNKAPQKPSPYPPGSEQGGNAGPDQSGQPSGQSPYPQQQTYPQQTYPQPTYPQQNAPVYPPSGNSLSWVPRGMEALGRTAAFHTDFTFDRSMLQLASGIWEGPGDPELADAISRLDGISVHSYHYAAPGMYDGRLLDTVRRQYTAMGWEHLVTAHSASTGGATDLWISFHHMRATGAVVLFQSSTNLNLIAFSGNISPLDLLHLRGHFGIPPFPGDRFRRAPGNSMRVPPPPRY